MGALNLLTVNTTTGKPKRVDSSGTTVDFLSVKVGASGLEIKETSSNFDFNAKKLTNIADGTSSSDAASKGQMDTANNLRVLKAGDTMSGILNMGGNKVTNLGSPTSNTTDAATTAYVDAAIAATGTSAEWQNSVLTATILDPTNIAGSPTAGDRYLIMGTGAGGWAGKSNQIAQYVSGTKTLVGSWTYFVPTTGTFTDADDNVNVLYYFGGSAWSAKNFEATTASGFLDKTGFDITLKNLANGKIILGDGSGIAQPVTPTGDVTISNAGVTTIAVDAVTTTKIIADAVTTAKILNANVTAAKLASDSVTTVKILDANVTAAKLASVTDGVTLDQSGAGSTLEIKALGVGTSQLAATGVTAAKLGSDVAGSGLTGGNGSAIAVLDTEAGTNDNAGAITIRQIVYEKANGNWDLALATNSLFGRGTRFGMVAAASISATASGSITTRKNALVPGFSSLTINAPVYISRGTSGGFSQDLSAFVAGDEVVRIGFAKSAVVVEFSPEFLFTF